MDTVVIGRDAELKAIEDWLEVPSPVLMLEGEAGIGKTTVWRSAIREADARGFRVLACAAVQAETQLSFTALRDLVESVYDDVAEKLPAPQRQTLDVTLLREPPGAMPPDHGEIGVSLLTTFRALGARAPTLIAIDDVQWVDPASASALAYVLRRFTETDRVVMLVAGRTDGATVERPLGLHRLDPAMVRIVPVDGLTIGALGRALRTHLGRAYPHPTLQRLHDVSGGNPFVALELARALGPSPPTLAPGVPLPVPTAWRALVDERLTALPPETLDALGVASALARPTLELLGAALDRDPVELLGPAVVAEIAALDKTSVRFTHPLFAAAVYDLVDSEARRQIHERLARIVTDPEERARHLALGADGPSEDVADALDEAARLAATRGAPTRPPSSPSSRLSSLRTPSTAGCSSAEPKRPATTGRPVTSARPPRSSSSSSRSYPPAASEPTP